MQKRVVKAFSFDYPYLHWMLRIYFRPSFSRAVVFYIDFLQYMLCFLLPSHGTVHGKWRIDFADTAASHNQPDLQILTSNGVHYTRSVL